MSDVDRKSVEPCALKAELSPQTLHEFLSLYAWDAVRMREHLQQIVALEHAGPNSIGLIDETSFVKMGTKTPGVQRQQEDRRRGRGGRRLPLGRSRRGLRCLWLADKLGPWLIRSVRFCLQ